VKFIDFKRTALVIVCILMFSGMYISGYASIKDTVHIYNLAEELYTDTLDIGPEFDVLDDAFLIDEEALPSFGEMLDQFVVPYRGKVISKYGMRRGRMHTGTDIKLELGDTIVAAYQGIVTRAQSYYGYGKLVVLNHSLGLETYYAHLSNILVKVGDTISTGQVIGLGGRTGRATGTHLHFEIRENGKAYNPELVFDFDSHSIKPEATEKEMLAQLVAKPQVVQKYVMDINDTPSEYIIKAGDSLWMIARRFQVSVSELCKLNNLTTQSVLRIGSVLRIY
jgi:murein DD-endopeptidase MepM/ murein hydrolase activator NlpD